MGETPHDDDGPLRAERAEEVARLRKAAVIAIAIAGVLAVLFAASQLRFVPELGGFEPDAAVARIDAAGLRPAVDKVYLGDPGDARIGSLLGQMPKPWGVVWRGSAVHIRYVAGSQRVRVPALEGLDAISAREFVHAAGLRLDEKKLEGHPWTLNPAGFHSARVSSVSPAPGSLIERARKVELFFRGPAAGERWHHWEAVADAGSASSCLGDSTDGTGCHNPTFCAKCHSASKDPSPTP